MKKLEDIPKKQVFTVPEGYFERLPNKIQARISQPEEKQPFFIFSLKYAFPVVVLMAAGIFWYSQRTAPQDAESMLASVQTEALIAYLDESELSTEDILEDVEFNADDVEAIESEVYVLPLDDETLDGLNFENDTL
jgi:hypothetical protein